MDLMTPKENLNGMTTKDAILYILSQAWPLSARKIYHEIKNKGNGKSISYQAVHKTLKSLVEGGILEKRGKCYKINIEWIEETEKFISALKDNYSKEKKQTFDGEMQFIFDTVYDVDKFMMEFKNRLLDKKTKERPIVCLHWKHYWIPLFLDKQVYRKMKDVIKHVRYYCIISGDTPVDKWCQEFWKKNNVNSICGVEDSGISNYLVFGDMVMQIFYPKEIMDEIDEMFSSAKSIHDIKMQRFFEQVFERKSTIPVTITTNPLLAEQLRSRILSYFNKKHMR